MLFTFNGVRPEEIEFNGNWLERVKCNGVTVWEKTNPDIDKPLKITATDGDIKIKFSDHNNTVIPDIWYSKNGGKWVQWTYDEALQAWPLINLNNGEYVSFKGNNPNGFNHGQESYCSILILNNSGDSEHPWGIASASGNIMSLIDNGACTTLTIPCDGCFCSLFSFWDIAGDTTQHGLRTAPILPATNLTPYCYSSMFSGHNVLTTPPTFYFTDDIAPRYCFFRMFYKCTSLLAVPNLHAHTMSDNCYGQMFYNCSSLTKIPQTLLPATTLADSCYQYMFAGCTSLLNVPNLPATTLAGSCYQYMFQNCKSLTSLPIGLLESKNIPGYAYKGMFENCTSLVNVPASLLPATTLSDYCYSRMFYNCVSLTTAPELPATTLVNRCYSEMFRRASTLNYVKCLATSHNNDNDTYYWLSDVAQLGTFVKKSGSTIWSTGVDGIPSGWTVQEE